MVEAKLLRFNLAKLLACAFLLHGQAHAERSLLLELSQELNCARSEIGADEILLRLNQQSAKTFGLPSDNLKSDDSARLYAASIDALLAALYRTQKRFPKLQLKVERTVLLWNYCHIIGDGRISDLSVDSEGEIIQYEAAKPFPAKRKGFGVWGFLDPDPGDRYIPELLADRHLAPRAFHEFIHNLYRKQCFPHPDSGKLYLELKELNLTGKLRIRKPFPLADPVTYPYAWQWEPVCTQISAGIDRKIKFDENTIDQEQGTPQISLLSQTKNLKSHERKYPKEAKASLELKAQEDDTNPLSKLTLPLSKSQNTQITVGKGSSNSAKAARQSEPVFKAYTEPEPKTPPITLTAVPTAGSNTTSALPLPEKDSFGFAGSLNHRWLLTGSESFGGSLSWNPISYFFIRGDFNYRYSPNSNQLSYSWGIGYDDWHPGTISVQINNWGPILPGEGFALDQATVNIAYKFDSNLLTHFSLAASAGIDIPITGDPSILATLIWSPIDKWYVRATVIRNLGKAQRWGLSYNFGRFDWQPFSIGLAYDNWGPNKAFEPNFTENGAVTLSWSFAF